MVEESITITVSGKENVDWIRSKVQTGNFASEAEFVTQEMAALRQEDNDLEYWLRSVVAERYDRHKANPETAITADQVLAQLEERRTQRAAKAH